MMLLFPEIKISVISAATALPEVEPTTNLEILNNNPSTMKLSEEQRIKLSKSIEKRYGMSKRYMIRKPWLDIQKNELSCEELAFQSLNKCYNSSSKNIEFFIHGTTTSSRYTGSQATAILSKLGLYSPAIEIKAGCSTSLASLNSGIFSIQSGVDNVMITCTETMTKVIGQEERENWFGFSDGGASIWLSQFNKDLNHNFKVLGLCFGTDGTLVDTYTTPGKLPPNKEDLENNFYTLKGDGSKLEEYSKKYYSQMFTAMNEKFNLEESINYIIPHQVNLNLINKVLKEFNLQNIPLLRNNSEIGNIGGSSVMYTLADSINKNIFKSGDRILMCSVGGGLTYCMQIWEMI